MFLDLMPSLLAVAVVFDHTYIASASHLHFITSHPVTQWIGYSSNVRTIFVSTADDL